MPLGFDSVHPGGMNENTPAFQRWERGSVVPSPEGTAEWVRYRPSLRGDLSPRASTPSVETTFQRWAILGGPSRTPTGIGLKTWRNRSSGAYPNCLSGLRPIEHLFSALAAGVSSTTSQTRQTLTNTLSSGRKPNQGRLKALRYAQHVHPPQPAAGRDVPRSGSSIVV